MLQDGRIVILDENGLSIFESEKTNGIRRRKAVNLCRKYKGGGRSKAGCFFGLFATRRAEIGTYVNDGQKGHMLVFVQNTTAPAKEFKIRESKIDFANFDDDYVIGRPNPMIRYLYVF